MIVGQFNLGVIVGLPAAREGESMCRNGSDAEKDTPAADAQRLDIVHKDIALANTYRLEMSKLLLTLAVALFAVSVAFQPGTVPVGDIRSLSFAWYALAVSVAGGIGNLYGWERFYISYRDYDLKNLREKGKEYRDCITPLRRIARFLQIAGLLTGAILMGQYTTGRLEHLAGKTTTGSEVTIGEATR